VKVDLGIWDRLTKATLLLLLLAAVVAVGVWYLPLIQQNERMRQEVLRLETQIKLEEETARQLKLSTDALRNDPKAVERLAREKLGYARPGETVVRFEPPPTNGTVMRSNP
jgi:cell division protein FtsB